MTTNVNFIIKDPMSLIPDGYFNRAYGVFVNRESIHEDFNEFYSILENRIQDKVEVYLLINNIDTTDDTSIEYKISELSKLFFDDNIAYLFRLDSNIDIPSNEFRYIMDILSQEGVIYLKEEDGVEYGIYLNNTGLALMEYYKKGSE